MAQTLAQQSRATRLDWLLPLISSILAGAWFLFLSQYLLLRSNGLIAVRQDVLFESDAANFVNIMISERWLPLFHTFTIAHPLVIYVWKPVILFLTFVFNLWWPHKVAGVVAVQFLIAGLAGVGTGSLVSLAIREGIRISIIIPLFAIYFLFTANTVAALPDHLGISSGLLTMTFVLLFSRRGSTARLVLLGLLAVLVTGTTVTNFLLPALCLLFALYQTKLYKASVVWRYRILIVTALMLAGLACAGLIVLNKAPRYVRSFFNNRLIQDPLAAGFYAASSIVYPAVGPAPKVVMQRDRGVNMVTYEPLAISSYKPIHVPAVLAWILLLGACIYHSLKNASSRAYAGLILIWIGFNVVFHNLWGDEFFLFSPHWSWALMALVLLGARHLPFTFVIATAIPILAGQTYTLMRIGEALKSISY